MKKIKITSALIIVLFICVGAWQNQDYFLQKNILDLNFYFKQFSLPETANGLYWIICFTIGFLISYFSSLAFRFKAQRKIKMQNQTIENYRETVQELKIEVEKIKASGLVNAKNRYDNENLPDNEQLSEPDENNEVKESSDEEKIE
ncbi:MAG: LapA family protein [Desulforegulaceae bacterium]|nr:LapA family protein [Desulforegulaceae bacterium]